MLFVRKTARNRRERPTGVYVSAGGHTGRVRISRPLLRPLFSAQKCGRGHAGGVRPRRKMVCARRIFAKGLRSSHGVCARRIKFGWARPQISPETPWKSIFRWRNRGLKNQRNEMAVFFRTLLTKIMLPLRHNCHQNRTDFLKIYVIRQSR